ncbi:endonuclease Q family protein [Niallia taxi]|uniref:endonuclease Q family protein n=1 Tax=Niallia taxi TaxID=2499688 RepID=UPI003981DAF4
MIRIFADLHIHIGRTASGKAVKITGSRTLTLLNIIEYASYQKGLDMIGIIDCHSPEILMEMDEYIAKGIMVQKTGGGLEMDGITIIPGSELEIYDDSCKGPIHVLCYMPTLTAMKEFSSWLSKYMKNIQLSSQRIYVTGKELQKKVKSLGGLFIPAHIFTPYKSLYGSGVKASLSEVFDPDLIDAVELGLSSNTMMADQIKELHSYTYITNSDAHSLAKIAREYQILEVEEASFTELEKALQGVDGRQVAENYGMDPLLGKYHNTVCLKCHKPLGEEEEVCSSCGHKNGKKGVAARIKELATAGDKPSRPPYIHQVPLEFIPGLGKKTLEKLLHYFSTEMQIIHEAPYEQLAEILPTQVAEYIQAARAGKLSLTVGGGGRYGRVSNKNDE